MGVRCWWNSSGWGGGDQCEVHEVSRSTNLNSALLQQRMKKKERDADRNQSNQRQRWSLAIIRVFDERPFLLALSNWTSIDSIPFVLSSSPFFSSWWNGSEFSTLCSIEMEHCGMDWWHRQSQQLQILLRDAGNMKDVPAWSLRKICTVLKVEQNLPFFVQKELLKMILIWI